MLRGLLLSVVTVLLLLPAVATAEIPEGTIKIGVLQDVPEPYAEEAGNGGIVAAQMAAGEFETQYLRGDAEILPGAAAITLQQDVKLAREWLDTEHVAAIVSSAGPLVDRQLAKMVEKRHATLLIAATDEAVNPKLCSPNVVVWGPGPGARARALAQALVPLGDRDWFLVASQTPAELTGQAALYDAVKAAGGKVVGSLDHIVGESDMRKALPKIDQARPQVVALAESEGDLVTSLRTASLAGLPHKTTLVAPFAQIDEVRNAGIAAAESLIVVTPFYWNTNRQTRQFALRWSKRMRSRHVTEDAATVYAAVSSFLHAAKAVDDVDSRKVVAQLRSKPIKNTLFGTVTVRKDGRVTSDLGVYRVKQPHRVQQDWDFYSKLAVVPGAQAYPPSACGGG